MSTGRLLAECERFRVRALHLELLGYPARAAMARDAARRRERALAARMQVAA